MRTGILTRAGLATVLSGAALLAATHSLPVAAQNVSRACPKASEVTFAHLLGQWRAQIEGAADATLVFVRHPQYRGVRGTINRGGERSELSGEVHDGEFLLEESTDGVAISATWVGEVAPGSCGREVRGNWRLERDKIERAFVLRKQ
ncbi:MAG: hypothetical protein V4684_08625 [Pseudomonadota bacterium]